MFDILLFDILWSLSFPCSSAAFVEAESSRSTCNSRSDFASHAQPPASPRQQPLPYLLWHRLEAAGRTGSFAVLLLLGAAQSAPPVQGSLSRRTPPVVVARRLRRPVPVPVLPFSSELGKEEGTGGKGGRGAAAGALGRTVTCQRLDEKREPQERRSRSQRRRRASMVL